MTRQIQRLSYDRRSACSTSFVRWTPLFKGAITTYVHWPLPFTSGWWMNHYSTLIFVWIPACVGHISCGVIEKALSGLIASYVETSGLQIVIVADNDVFEDLLYDTLFSLGDLLGHLCFFRAHFFIELVVLFAIIVRKPLKTIWNFCVKIVCLGISALHRILAGIKCRALVQISVSALDWLRFWWCVQVEAWDRHLITSAK